MNRCVDTYRTEGSASERRSFAKRVGTLEAEVAALKRTNGKARKTFLQYFYAILNTVFMERWLEQELPARHLAQMSQLMSTFLEYYDYEWVRGTLVDRIWDRFFNSFLRVLLEGGLNEYEEEEQAFPSGAVQVMTFHQSKGLEFPVIIVGDLHAQVSSGKKVDQMLGQYYNRTLHEPLSKTSAFDKRRLYYVAFSRAKNFLTLTHHDELTDTVLKRKKHFEDVLEECEPWERAKAQGDYRKVQCQLQDPTVLKPVLGFTSHINAYERCPRQFLYQKQYGFAPVRNEQFWMGTVVHNTLKDIHDHILKEKEGALTPKLVKTYLDQNIDVLRRQGIEPQKLSPARLAAGEKPLEDVAYESIQRYVDKNEKRLRHCRWAEKEILVDQDDYTLTGVVDLLIHDDSDYVELVDFKAGQRKKNVQFLEGYHDQVRLYCRQVEGKVGKVPDEGYIYWVTDPSPDDPKDMVDIDPALLDDTRQRVHKTATSIIQGKFPRRSERDKDICGICEFEERCWS
jgi:ATP-dependent DNA helicase UvrD/PcrA